MGEPESAGSSIVKWSLLVYYWVVITGLSGFISTPIPTLSLGMTAHDAMIQHIKKSLSKKVSFRAPGTLYSEYPSNHEIRTTNGIRPAKG